MTKSGERQVVYFLRSIDIRCVFVYFGDTLESCAFYAFCGGPCRASSQVIDINRVLLIVWCVFFATSSTIHVAVFIVEIKCDSVR